MQPYMLAVQPSMVTVQPAIVAVQPYVVTAQPYMGAAFDAGARAGVALLRAGPRPQERRRVLYQ
eukprot:1830114-Rhodomonas_salina.1